jgi:hypothetical protein
VIVVRTKAVRLARAGAITVWPLLLVDPEIELTEARVAHEGTHGEQQRRWFIYGLGVGLIVWWLLYLLALPVGWNWWRARWEREAYRAEGRSDDAIDEVLREPPYYLWWG